jgi:hypothetical protein
MPTSFFEVPDPPRIFEMESYNSVNSCFFFYKIESVAIAYWGPNKQQIQLAPLLRLLCI